jgi:hypothetical protein
VAAIYLWPTADVPRDLLRAEAPSPQRGAVAPDPAARSAAWTSASASANVQPVRFAGSGSSGASSGFYDVAQGETSLMLFEAEDGSMVIWLLEEDDLSHASVAKGRV